MFRDSQFLNPIYISGNIICSFGSQCYSFFTLDHDLVLFRFRLLGTKWSTTVQTSSSHRAGQGVSQDHFGSLIHHMVLEITLGSHFRLRSHFSENSVTVFLLERIFRWDTFSFSSCQEPQETLGEPLPYSTICYDLVPSYPEGREGMEACIVDFASRNRGWMWQITKQHRIDICARLGETGRSCY